MFIVIAFLFEILPLNLSLNFDEQYILHDGDSIATLLKIMNNSGSACQTLATGGRDSMLGIRFLSST